MVGVPVIINHKDLNTDNVDDERVGVVNSVWYDERDGWYWCDGIIWDETAQNLITDKNWSVSCSYNVKTANDEGGSENNIKYDMEFLDGVFTHLALVDNPRYERANIVFNSKDNFAEQFTDIFFEALAEVIVENRLGESVNNDKWITIHPNGEDAKGKHLLLKDGESPKEAIKRTYGGNNKEPKKHINHNKDVEHFIKTKENLYEKWSQALEFADKEFQKIEHSDFEKLPDEEKVAIFDKIDKAQDMVDKAQKAYENFIEKEKEYIISNSSSLKDGEPVAGVKKGKPMDFEKANGGKVNPNYNPDYYEYSHNCQSCVVAYEARRRGYDIQVVERGEYDKTQQLAEHSFWAFIDPETNKVCEPELINAKNSVNLYNQLNSKIKPSGRYVFSYDWDNGKEAIGHIQIVERNQNGELQFYDPQSGVKISNKEKAINYLKNKCILYGKNTPQELLRIDDKQFNTYFINDIVRKN